MTWPWCCEICKGPFLQNPGGQSSICAKGCGKQFPRLPTSYQGANPLRINTWEIAGYPDCYGFDDGRGGAFYRVATMVSGLRNWACGIDGVELCYARLRRSLAIVPQKPEKGCLWAIEDGQRLLELQPLTAAATSQLPVNARELT